MAKRVTVQQAAVQRNVQVRFPGFTDKVADRYWGIVDDTSLKFADQQFVPELLPPFPNGIDVRDLDLEPDSEPNYTKDHHEISDWATLVYAHHGVIESIIDGEVLIPTRQPGDWLNAGRIINLEAEIARLRADNARLATELIASTTIEELPAKRVASIYRIILGVAIKNFSYQPGLIGKAPTKIEGVLAGTPFHVRHDTILDILRDAALHLDVK